MFTNTHIRQLGTIKMNRLSEIVITLCLLTTFWAFTPTDTETQKINEGQSVGELKIGMTIYQVDSILKTKPEKIIWTNHSFEYKYEKEGISVFELQNDSTHKVFSISVNLNKWNGITNKGLRVSNRLKIKNIINIYGKPEWRYTTDCSELDAEYSTIGIYFSVDTIGGICDETIINHDSLFYDHIVTELTIGEVGTDY